MKIVLREHVEHLGNRGEIVSVATGYARNYLVPKGLAWEATPGNIKTLDMRRKSWEAQESREVDAARQFAEQLAGVELTITKKAGESDTLYGSVTTSEIAKLLAAEGHEIDRRKIELKEPIKNLGKHRVPIRLYRGVIGEVSLEVVAEAATD